MTLAPIVLFVYNRPMHTKRVVQSLLDNTLSKESTLIIYSDGPKNADSKNSVSLVREYIRTISGFKEINIVESQSNKGLAKSIIDGVTEIVNQYGKIIVLEDDLVLSPNFLSFMNKSLEKYCDDFNVMQVAGYMYDIKIRSQDDAIFLPLTTGWGWATWKRAWNDFGIHANVFDILKNDRKLRKKFNLYGNYNFYGLLSSQLNDQVDTWGVFWYLSVFLKNGLVVYPTKSLVLNKGFDGSGTNCGFNIVMTNIHKVFNSVEEFRLPTSIKTYKFEKNIYKQINKELNQSLSRRIINKILKIIK